jgi:hypothetical protein
MNGHELECYTTLGWKGLTWTYGMAYWINFKSEYENEVLSKQTPIIQVKVIQRRETN